MNKRIQQFIEIENLSPSKLADKLGIQRSGISHILQERNKPSYDFIVKFLKAFPNVNPDWLLTGQGKIYRDSGGEAPLESAPLLLDFDNSAEITQSEEYTETIKYIEKKVCRITIFYSDGSFQEFYPNK